MARVRPLHVYLLTAETAMFDGAIDPDKVEDLSSVPLELPGATGRLYWRSNPTGPPTWYSFLEDAIDEPLEFLTGSSSAAVALVRVQGRTFALVFGQGARSLLRSGSYELDFGLRVTLNRVARERLKSIETRSFEDNPMSTVRQAGREADLAAFGVSRSRDLLSAVAGVPADPDFGTWVAGKDALVWRGYADVEDIPSRCRSFLDAFEDDVYQEHFGWVDTFKRVRGEAETALWVRVVDHLQARRTERVVVAPPDMVDWTAAYSYRIIVDKSQTVDKPAPSVEDYYFLLPNPHIIDMDRLHKDRIEVVDENGQVVNEWRMWQCITFEAHIDGSLFVLHGGQWFQVDQTLTAEVDELLASVPTQAIDLPPAGPQQIERHYNDQAGALPGLTCLDRALVVCRDARTPIEACDLLSDERHLVHVKCLHGSASLSHLYVQATTSSRALRVDTAFREGFRQRIQEREGNPDLVPPVPDGESWHVVLAVITPPQQNWPLGLPFLAKYGMFDCIRELQAQAYEVTVQQIPRN